MARRYSRRRDDGIVEYSESLEELESSAVREDEKALRRTFALIGLLLGAVVIYGLLKLYFPDWPKFIRFMALLAGACSSAFIFARLALALRTMFAIAIAVGVLGGVRQLTRRKAPVTTAELIQQINPVVRGWGEHFKGPRPKVISPTRYLDRTTPVVPSVQAVALRRLACAARE